MRRRAELECLQHMAKALLGYVHIQPNQPNDLLLYLSLVNSDAAKPTKQQQRCLKIREALTLLEGKAETKSQLVKKYMEQAEIKSKSTANKHIDAAVKNGFIQQEYWQDGSITKARYFLK